MLKANLKGKAGCCLHAPFPLTQLLFLGGIYRLSQRWSWDQQGGTSLSKSMQYRTGRAGIELYPSLFTECSCELAAQHPEYYLP